MSTRFPLAALLALAVTAAAPAGDCTADKKADIVSTAIAAGTFKTLAAALEAGDLVTALRGEGPFTVFAPTDDAFAKLPKGTVETLLKPENKDRLRAILTYHVVPGAVGSAKVVKRPGAETLNGQRVAFASDRGAVRVGTAKVVRADIHCSNGVIHVIDSVLIPTEKSIPVVAQEAGTFRTLLAAAKAAGLAETLANGGPFTVFAPTDDAFAKLPEGTVAKLLEPANREQLVQILSYHVVEGRVYSDGALRAGKAVTLQRGPVAIRVKDGTPMVENAAIVATDIEAKNGVIHVIDTVLIPKSDG